MLQLGARFYWPEIGRFVSQDPIGNGMNWYVYVDGNPVVEIDPEGFSAREWWEVARALGSYEGSWRAITSPRCTGSAAYYRAWWRGMTGWESVVSTAAPVAYSHRGLGPLWSARLYYVATDGRFKNLGRKSKKLVPRLVGKITPWATRANALSSLVTFGQSIYYTGQANEVLVWYE